MPKYADLHIHSKYSSVGLYDKKAPLYEKIVIDCASEVENIFRIARARGLSAIAIADHDNQLCTSEAKKFSKKYDVVFIPAVEIGSEGGHIVALGVEAVFRPNRPIEETVLEIKEKGGLAVAVHPFPSHRHDLTHIKAKKAVIVDDVNSFDFDAVEEYNSIFGEAVDKKQIVKEIAYIAGSDAHTYYQIGKYQTVFSDECTTVEDYLEAIRNHKTTTVGRKPNFVLMLLAGARAHLWDRFFLKYN